MFGGAIAAIAIAQAEADMERRAVERARASLTPEQFDKWQADRTAERRHQELCAAIRASRPRGSFILGTGRFE